MKPLIIISLLLFAAMPATAMAQDDPVPACDEYGMRVYQMGFLSRGDNWTAEVTEETRQLQEAHLANIGRLADEGSLLIAGPFVYDESDEDISLRGIFIFDVESREEAERLAATDPAVAEGRLAIRVIPWYGPCGLTYDAPEEKIEPPDGRLFIVHFTTGPAWRADVPFQQQDHAGAHSENLKRLREEGALLLGARYADKGMIVIRAATEEQARARIERDPAVEAGVFVYALAPFHPFYDGYVGNR